MKCGPNLVYSSIGTLDVLTHSTRDGTYLYIVDTIIICGRHYSGPQKCSCIFLVPWAPSSSRCMTIMPTSPPLQSEQSRRGQLDKHHHYQLQVSPRRWHILFPPSLLPLCSSITFKPGERTSLGQLLGRFVLESSKSRLYKNVHKQSDGFCGLASMYHLPNYWRHVMLLLLAQVANLG